MQRELKNLPVEARVYLVGCERDRRLMHLCLRSAKATGQDMSRFHVLMTDGSMVFDFERAHEGVVCDSMKFTQGHPQAVNEAFTHILRDSAGRFDFLFVEPDCTFLRPNVAEILQDECYGMRCSILGYPTYQPQNGWTVNGVQFYRHDCWDKIKDRLLKCPPNAPFDFWISEILWPRILGPTGAISHVEPPPHFTDLDWIHPQSILHHGEKTGALSRLIIDNDGQWTTKSQSPSVSSSMGWIRRFIPRSFRKRG